VKKLSVCARYASVASFLLSFGFASGAFATGKVLIGDCCSDFIYSTNKGRSEYLTSRNFEDISPNKFGLLLETGIEAGNLRDILDFGVVLPILGNRERLVFFDGKAKFYNEKEREYSIGLGLRKKFSAGMLCGFNAFRDMRFIGNDDYFWHSVGAELFWNKLELRVNKYMPGAKSKVVTVHSLSDDLLNTVLEVEKASSGFDFIATVRHQNLAVYGAVYKFDGDQDSVINGFRAGTEIMLGKKTGSVFLVNPEFFTDNIRGDNFSVRLGIKAAIGRNYGSIANPVIRDKDIVLIKSRERRDVEKVILKADQDYQIKKITRSSNLDGSGDLTGEDLLLLDSDLEISGNNGIKNAKKIAGNADLEVFIKNAKDPLVVKHNIQNQGQKLTLSGDARLQDTLVTGLQVKTRCMNGANMKNVTFFDTQIETCDGDHAFKNDNNVRIIRSIIDDSTNKEHPLFYSDASDPTTSKYVLQDVQIKTINNLDSASLFGSDDKSRNKIHLGGKIKIQKKEY
jgi:hypothetical protein